MSVKLLECNHCGNKGNLEVISNFTNYKEEGNGTALIYWSQTQWFLLRCPVCGDAVLYREDKDIADVILKDGKEEYVITPSIAYPNVTIELKNTPEDIATAYKAAVKTLNINHEISFLSFRMVLEKIVNDKAAKGKKLITKINDLTARNIFPQILKDCSSIVRILGNGGAHGSMTEKHVSKNDVICVKNLIEYILEYTYETPYKIQKLSQRFNLESKIENANKSCDLDEK